VAKISINSLSSLVNGMNSGYRMVRDIQRDDEDRKFVTMQRVAAEKRMKEEDALKTNLGNAATPTEIAPDEVYQPAVDDEGNQMPANPTAGRVKVAGQHFTNMADATKARDAYNGRDAVNARMSDVYLRAGRPGEAQQLRTGARQEQVANLQATQLQQAADRDAKLREVGGLIIKGGWASVPEVYARYDDGHSAKVEPDGKGGATVIGIDGGGKEVSRIKYGSLPEFFSDVAGQFDPSKWQAAQERKADRAEGERRWTAEMDLRTEAEKRRQAHEDRMFELVKNRGAAGQQSAPIWDEKADNWLRQRYTSKDQTGALVVDGDGLAFAKQLAVAMARDKFGGDTTTALGQAIDVDQKITAAAGGDPAKVRAARQQALAALIAPQGAPTQAPSKAAAISADAQKTGVKDFLVDINGTRGAYGGAKMSDFATSAVGPGGGQPASPTPAAPAPSPVMARMSSAMQYLSDLGTDYNSDAGKALLASRVAEAAKGGKALSEVEALRARQLGLLGKAS
jgi:hypothetical protein